MHTKLVVALAVGGAIAIGGTAGAAVAGRDTTSTSTPSTSTSPVTTPATTPGTGPGSVAPGGAQTVTIGDVGTLTATFGTDGALLDALVLPAPGFVVTGPFETSEGLMVTLTGPDGVAQTFEIEVSDGEIEIRPETGIGDDRFDDRFDDRGRNRGPGDGGDDRDDGGSDDNSGPGSGDHDSSGPGSGTSGSGSGGDDDSDNSGSGHSGSDD
jgi:hypothetical protein